MNEIYCFIIPLNEDMYNSAIDPRLLLKFRKNNKIKDQLEKYFPHYDVEKTIFAFQTPKLDLSKCSYHFRRRVNSYEEWLPVDFVNNYSAFVDLPLYKINKGTSDITRLDDMTEEDKLIQMFIYKQQLENPQSLILYLLQNRTIKGYKKSKRKYTKSKRNNCCFENLVFIDGHKWAFLNHDECAQPNISLLEELINCWFNNK